MADIEETEKKAKKCPPHKYRRRNLTRNKDKEAYFVYKCIECPHYVRLELAVGLEARCYKCNGLYTVTNKQVSTVAKPTCPQCVIKSSKNKQLEQDVDNLLEEIFKGEI